MRSGDQASVPSPGTTSDDHSAIGAILRLSPLPRSGRVGITAASLALDLILGSPDSLSIHLCVNPNVLIRLRMDITDIKIPASGSIFLIGC